MELNWSTFVLEIINFVILIWILKRFLYRPVLNVIEQRQAAINEKSLQAETLKSQADVLLNSYNNRLSDWQQEKQVLKQALDQEIQQERAVRIQKLKDELGSERKKAAVIEQRKQAELQQQAESTAITMASRFAAKLFADLSGPEIERRLLKLFVDELHAMPEERRHNIQSDAENASGEISIHTAYQVDPADSRMLESAMQKLIGNDIAINFIQTPELIAGVKVIIGAFVLQANLKDELNDFARFSHDNSVH